MKLNNPILLVSNKNDITTDYIISELYKRNISFYRFNTEDFPLKTQIKSMITNNCFCIQLADKDSIIDVLSIKSVWYWRPEIPYFKEIDIDKANKEYCIKESFFALENLWASLDTFWINNPLEIKRSENKQLQLKKASELGFHIPNTLISNNYNKVKEFYRDNNENIIIKPLNAAVINYENQKEAIYTNLITKTKLKKIDQMIPIPSIYQANVPKKCDIRITIVGDRIFPVEIHTIKSNRLKIDWRKEDNKNLQYKKHRLPKEIEKKCLLMLKTFNLSYAAIDMILTPKNEYYFLEINPNGMWAWIENRTGFQISKAIVDLLCSR